MAQGGDVSLPLRRTDLTNYLSPPDTPAPVTKSPPKSLIPSPKKSLLKKANKDGTLATFLDRLVDKCGPKPKKKSDRKPRKDKGGDAVAAKSTTEKKVPTIFTPVFEVPSTIPPPVDNSHLKRVCL